MGIEVIDLGANLKNATTHRKVQKGTIGKNRLKKLYSKVRVSSIRVKIISYEFEYKVLYSSAKFFSSNSLFAFAL